MAPTFPDTTVPDFRDPRLAGAPTTVAAALAAGFARHRASATPCLLIFRDEGYREVFLDELLALAQRGVATLKAEGVEPGDVVGVFAANRLETVAAILAILRVGAVVCPIDPQYTGQTLVHLVENSGARLLLGESTNTERLSDASITAPSLIHLDGPEAPDHPEVRPFFGEASDESEYEPDPAETVALFYTSGTTGLPKGVPLTQANIAYEFAAILEEKLMGETDRLLQPLPLHHVYPMVLGTLGMLAWGGTIVIPRAMTGPQIVRALREGGVTVLLGVPRLYAAVNEGIRKRFSEAGFVASRVLKSLYALCRVSRQRYGLQLGSVLMAPIRNKIGPDLRMLCSGGSPLDPELYLDLEALGFNVAIGYGQTETSPMVAFNGPGTGKANSIGSAMVGTTLRIDETSVPQGTEKEIPKGAKSGVGELQVYGPGVFGGYHELPEKTSETFTEDGWLKTGDLGYFDADGDIVLTGRASTLIVTQGGENVQPDMVEAVLDAHPLVKESGVLERKGELVTLLVPAVAKVRERGLEMAQAGAQALKEVAAKLPSYARPTTYAVSREPLARTRLGKLQRHSLKEQFEAAFSGTTNRDVEGLAPMNPADMAPEDRRLLEGEAAALVWQWLAERYPRQGLSPDSDLSVDLGVDSLGWLNLTMDLSQRTGIELSEEAIARIHSVRELLTAIREADTEKTERTNPVKDSEQYLDETSRRYLAPISSVQRVLAKLLRGLIQLLCAVYFRYSVAGLARIPKDRQIVITPNHLSYLDPFLLVSMLPLSLLARTFFAAYVGAAFANRFTSFFARLSQAFPIDARRHPARSLALGAEVLKRGHNLLWFPEGTRSRTGKLTRFKPGLGLILKEYSPLVLPMALTGTYEAMPPGGFWIRPRKVRMLVGEPVETATLLQEGTGESEEDRIMDGLRGRVAALLKDLEHEQDKAA